MKIGLTNLESTLNRVIWSVSNQDEYQPKGYIAVLTLSCTTENFFGASMAQGM